MVPSVARNQRGCQVMLSRAGSLRGSREHAEHVDDADERLGPIIALVVALALVIGATRADEPALVILGVAGTLVATQAVLATSFDGAVAAAIVALIGMLLVVGVIVRSTRRDRAQDG